MTDYGMMSANRGTRNASASLIAVSVVLVLIGVVSVLVLGQGP